MFYNTKNYYLQRANNYIKRRYKVLTVCIFIIVVG